MPQLDPYIFMSQFSWFLFFFFIIYYGGVFPKLLASCEWLLTSQKLLKLDKRKSPSSSVVKGESLERFGYGMKVEEVFKLNYRLKR